MHSTARVAFGRRIACRSLTVFDGPAEKFGTLLTTIGIGRREILGLRAAETGCQSSRLYRVYMKYRQALSIGMAPFGGTLTAWNIHLHAGQDTGWIAVLIMGLRNIV